MFTTGAIVMCLIQVTVLSDNIPFIVGANAEGRVKSSNANMSVVDFSKQAKELAWNGKYDKVLVENTKCVELK